MVRKRFWLTAIAALLLLGVVLLLTRNPDVGPSIYMLLF